MRQLVVSVIGLAIGLAGCVSAPASTNSLTAVTSVSEPTAIVQRTPEASAVAGIRSTRTPWPTRFHIPTPTPLNARLTVVEAISWVTEEMDLWPLLADASKWLVSDSEAIRAIEAKDGKVQWRYALPVDLNGDRTQVWSTAVSVDGSVVAVGYGNGEIYTLSAADGTLIRAIATDGAVEMLGFSAVGNTLYSISRPYDGVPLISYWSLASEMDGTLDEGGNGATFLGATDILVTTYLRVFDVDSRRRTETLDANYIANNIVSSSNGRWLSANQSDTVRVWRVAGKDFEPVGVPPECMALTASGVVGIAPISNGGRIAVISYPENSGLGDVRLCDLEKQQYLGEVRAVDRFFFLDDDRLVMSMGDDPTLTIWEWVN